MDLIVGSTWIVLSLYSVIANVSLIVSIGTSARMRATPSFWIIASHAVCDMGMSVMAFIHAIPSIFLHELYFTYESLTNVIMLLFYDIFWYTEVVHLSVMAINRYICIVYPSSYAKCFSWKMTVYILFSSYMLGIAVSLPTQFPCCYTLWDSYDYFAKYVGAGGW
ncbi:unnamed protein product [Cylicocyclus nassatus]|uniref:G-protein coupled receptors family 1 profile domain-containing protein n=1 Tax=Cylicocyclus nassatus TaxID=53992 RepID=A0AA36MDK3_CYLNA|nr:unnamed protein product [Cylicocyclus nassatus]